MSVVTLGDSTGQDQYGNDVRTQVVTVSPGWVIWPATVGAESVQGQDVITDTLVAFAPVGTDVTAIDHIVWNGGTYDVQGSPWQWQSPFTGDAVGVQVDLKRVTG